MRLVIQRVLSAEVTVHGESVGSIEKGLLVLVGIGKNDTDNNAEYLVEKLLNMRIFEDIHGKLNKSLIDINGELLLVPNFTLYANCKKGNRPNFFDAAAPEDASKVFDYFISVCSKKYNLVKTGKFGEYMNIELINDGPVTIILEN